MGTSATLGSTQDPPAVGVTAVADAGLRLISKTAAQSRRLTVPRSAKSLVRCLGVGLLYCTFCMIRIAFFSVPSTGPLNSQRQDVPSNLHAYLRYLVDPGLGQE